MSKEKILLSTNLAELLIAIDDFCKESQLRDDDTKCMELKSELENADNNDYFAILSSYMSVADDGDEVIEALYEFADNCRHFVDAKEEITEQITKDEFEAVLEECDEKCGVLSCIETEHAINVAEMPMTCDLEEMCVKEKNGSFNIFLPKVNILEAEDKEKFISNIIGNMLYTAIKKRLAAEFIHREINRYIPYSRKEEKTVRQLFVHYFYDVVKYKKQKPRVYTHFDKHLERVISLEFYKRIIKDYFNEVKKDNNFQLGLLFI